MMFAAWSSIFLYRVTYNIDDIIVVICFFLLLLDEEGQRWSTEADDLVWNGRNLLPCFQHCITRFSCIQTWPPIIFAGAHRALADVQAMVAVFTHQNICPLPSATPASLLQPRSFSQQLRAWVKMKGLRRGPPLWSVPWASPASQHPRLRDGSTWPDIFKASVI